MVAETPDDIKNLDSEKIEDKGTKEKIEQYNQDLKNVKINEFYIRADIFAYHTLENIEKEIKKLLI